MTSYWCEFAWLGGEAVVGGVVIDVDSGRISSITTGVQPCPTAAVRLAGVTLPGMANAHSHAFHRLLRGRTHAGPGSFWTWREQMYTASRVLDPSNYFVLASAVFAEMAMAGISAVGEFHYVHHGRDASSYDDRNAMGNALIAAANQAGIRITLLDACYLYGGLRADGHYAPSGDQSRFSDGSVSAWIDRVRDLRGSDVARVGAAIHSVRAVDEESMAAVGEYASAAGQPLHVHLSEQPEENELCLAATGLTPTQLLDRAGVLGPNLTAVHATHLTDSDIDLLGTADSKICMCPTTERDLADGIGPSLRLTAAGCLLCLGSDSHAVIDMLAETRAVELNERLVHNVRGNHSVGSLLAAATVNGHRSLGWDDAGELIPGSRADLVTVGLDSVRVAGTEAANALGSVVYAATAADIRHVVIDGRVVVRDGQHVSIDVVGALSGIIKGFTGV